MQRTEVLRYAEAMEQKLQANDEEKGTTGWKGCTIDFLLSKLDEESDELKDVAKGLAIFEKSILIAQEYDQGITNGDVETLKIIRDGIRRFLGKESADVGNICMMISDVCGALPEVSK
jgi:hypothetical protein